MQNILHRPIFINHLIIKQGKKAYSVYMAKFSISKRNFKK